MPTEHQSIVGKLTRVPHGLPTGDAYYLEKDNGEFLNIKFVGGHADSSVVPLNTKIALCMSTKEIDGFRVVCTHQPYFTELR